MQHPSMTDRVNCRAKQVLANALGMSEISIFDDAGIDSLAEWTSLRHISVIEEIESTLDRKLTTEEMLTVIDLKAIVRLLLDELKNNRNILD